MSQDGEVRRRVIFPYSAFVFAKGNVEHPMKAVLNAESGLARLKGADDPRNSDALSDRAAYTVSRRLTPRGYVLSTTPASTRRFSGNVIDQGVDRRAEKRFLQFHLPSVFGEIEVSKGCSRSGRKAMTRAKNDPFVPLCAIS